VFLDRGPVLRETDAALETVQPGVEERVGVAPLAAEIVEAELGLIDPAFLHKLLDIVHGVLPQKAGTLGGGRDRFLEGELPAETGLQTLQVPGHLAQIGIPLIPFFHEATLEDGFERRRTMRIFLADGCRCLVHDLEEDLRNAAAVERLGSGEHFIHDDAHGKLVGTPIQVAALHLLGGHVAHRPHHHAGPGHGGGGHLGDAEIDYLDGAVLEQKDVSRLHVTVDDAAPVGVVQRLATLASDAQHLVEALDLLLLDRVLEIGALQKFHGDERGTVFFAEIVNGDDVEVPEAARRFRLSVEALEQLGILAEIAGKGLQCDRAFENGVIRAVDDPHCALAEYSLNFIFAQLVEHAPSGASR